MKDVKRWLPGALISIILIAALVYFVDFGEMAEAIRKADYRYLAMAFPLAFVFMAIRAVAWRILLRKRASYRDVFLTVGEGYLMNSFLPFRLGELGRAFLLSRKSDLQLMEILPTIVIERVVDLGFSAAVLLASLPFVVGVEGAERIGFSVGAVVVAGLFVLFLVAKNRQWALRLFNSLSQRWPVLQRFGGGIVESFLEGLAVLTDGWLFTRFMVWMSINWAVSLLAYYLLIRAFFPQAQWMWALFGLGVSAFGNAIPSLPGAIGTFEGAFSGALVLLKGDESTAFAAALAGRLYNYIATITIGMIGLSSEGQTLSGVYQQLREFRARQKELGENV